MSEPANTSTTEYRASTKLDDDSAQAWLSKWLPLPAGIPRGPYARPTRDVLLAVEAGLKARLERLANEK